MSDAQRNLSGLPRDAAESCISTAVTCEFSLRSLRRLAQRHGVPEPFFFLALSWTKWTLDQPSRLKMLRHHTDTVQ